MYFRYGGQARPEVESSNCFAAVVARERTSTTRFEEDSADQFRRWLSLRVGDVVRIWSGPCVNGQWTGDHALIEVTAPAQSINFESLDTEGVTAWSKAEGWAPSKIVEFILTGKTRGIQIRYRVITHL